MIFRNLTVNNFGRFERLDLELGPGLTVIKGPNEAGKSTLQSALMLALFGDPRSRSRTAGLKRRWGQDDYYNVSLRYDVKDESYVLEKDFAAQKERLRSCSTDEETTDRDAILAAVSCALGVSSEELYRATACITQDNIARISGKGRQQVSEQLQKVITGGAGDAVATQCTDLLRAKAAELRRGLDRPATNPGLIKQSRDTISRLRSDLMEAQLQMEILREALGTAEQSAREMEEKSERLSAIRRLIAGHDKRVRLCADRDEAAKSEDALQSELEAIDRLRQVIAEKKEQISAFDGLDKTASDSLQTLAKIEALLESYRASESGARHELTELRSSQRPDPRVLVAGLAATLLAVIAVVCIVADAYLPAGLALLGSAALLFVRQSLAARARRFADKVAEAERLLARMQRQAQSAEEDLRAFLNECGCDSAQMFHARWSEWTSAGQELSKAEAELSGRLAGRAPDDIEQERKRWSRARRDAQEQLSSDGVDMFDLTPLQRQQYEMESRRLEAEIAELNKQDVASRAIIHASHADLLDAYRIDEELTVEQDRLRRLERLAKVYSTAAEGIQEAVAGTLRDGKEHLESAAGRYLSVVTGGRYCRVEVDERSLGFHLYSDEKNGIIAADGEELSRGTIDQFYLSARLALLDVICGEARPPLLLDDPFVTFDDERAARAMELCRKICGDRQVILFTCSDRYDSGADHILNIAGILVS